MRIHTNFFYRAVSHHIMTTTEALINSFESAALTKLIPLSTVVLVFPISSICVIPVSHRQPLSYFWTDILCFLLFSVSFIFWHKWSVNLLISLSQKQTDLFPQMMSVVGIKWQKLDSANILCNNHGDFGVIISVCLWLTKESIVTATFIQYEGLMLMSQTDVSYHLSIIYWTGYLKWCLSQENVYGGFPRPAVSEWKQRLGSFYDVWRLMPIELLPSIWEAGLELSDTRCLQ